MMAFTIHVAWRAASRLATAEPTTTTTPPSAAPMGIMPQAKNRYTLLTRPRRYGGMIVWRRLTVITFHKMPTNDPMPKNTITAGHHGMSPMSVLSTASDARTSARQVPEPSRREIRDAIQPPATPPIAPPNPKMANTKGDVPRTSWAYSTKVAPLTIAAMFMNPRTMHIDRSRSWRHSQPKPSFNSSRHGARTCPSVCGARNAPGMVATRAAAAKKETASSTNGRKNAAPSSREPTGGPTKVFITNSTEFVRPFAVSRSSASTTAGNNVWPELSRSTSAMPSSSVATSTRAYSIGCVPVTDPRSPGSGSASCCINTPSATTVVNTPRARSMDTIARRRSTRSVITPAGNVKTSHGRRWAANTRATRMGFRVTADASHG
jgi:hypothetical protein